MAGLWAQRYGTGSRRLQLIGLHRFRLNLVGMKPGLFGLLYILYVFFRMLPLVWRVLHFWHPQ